ncbi:unnamed protein product [Durusdinium trenchii]|uniref:Poly [ADP-ribose] polymerase n=1 Tax=Durusdinium trenchii TaxID=1381693 RepID=A0ABP0PDD9_9DINO
MSHPETPQRQPRVPFVPEKPMAGTLDVHVLDCYQIKSTGSFFSGHRLFISVKVEGIESRSPAVAEASGSVAWDFATQLPCQANLELVLKREGLFSSHFVGGCTLPLQQVSQIEQEVPLWDASRQEVGRLRIRLTRARGLMNRAGSQIAGVEGAASHGLMGAGPSLPPGGLVNRANTAGLAAEPGTGGRSGPLGSLANYGRAATSDMESRPAFARGSSQTLANLAAAREDGSRPDAVRRSGELLAEVDPFDASREEHRQKLAQAVERLRCASDTDLSGPLGQQALQGCEARIQALFDDAMQRRNEKDTHGALWLAGRLPSPEEAEVTLQLRLRQKWDLHSLKEALNRAAARRAAAEQGGTELEDFMDALDLAEFHGRAEPERAAAAVEQLLKPLEKPLAGTVQQLLERNELDKAEAIFGALGARRTEALQLQPLQQRVLREKGLQLLKAALWPAAGQHGFPELKRRKLRHAMLTARSAMDDPANRKALGSMMLEVAGPCFAHSTESAAWFLRAYGELLPEEQVNPAIQRLVRERPDQIAAILTETQKLLEEIGREVPDGLLPSEWQQLHRTVREALAKGNDDQLKVACQKLIDSPAGVFYKRDLQEVVGRLRSAFRLPPSWSVESMLRGSADKLLAKNEVTDGTLLRLFDELLRSTALPHVRTRDRRGLPPRNFRAVKAVQIMNAPCWASYLQRRDHVLQQCLKVKARSDATYWREGLNGALMTDALTERMEVSAFTPLKREANECWLFHGTSHHAAEGITTDDFDMTRANPAGLFGAGVYFAESVSKADEYVKGKHVDGVELFPLLLCRVCLGYIYYCDQRRPSARELEEHCLLEDWHSVLGDRKKTSNTFREFIIYDNLQAFPAYIIYYSREEIWDTIPILRAESASRTPRGRRVTVAWGRRADGCMRLLLPALALGADVRKKSDDFWTCADDLRWHRLRETVRYVVWKPGDPLRTSVEGFATLVPLWLSISTGHENLSQLTEESPCPAGEVFFMLLHFLMSQLKQLRKDGSIDMEGLVSALAMLRVRIPSMSGALRSTWPIFGVLALIQQKLLKLGVGGVRGTGMALRHGAAPFSEALLQFAGICEDGQELFQHISTWLEVGMLPSKARLAAWATVAGAGRACDGQHQALARLVARGALPAKPWQISLDEGNASEWRKDFTRLLTFLDHSLLSTSWNRLVFSGWPLLAVLHRLQEIHFRDACCASAGGYLLRSRSARPSSAEEDRESGAAVWLCVSRHRGDLVAERWRSHGEFADCSAIAQRLGVAELGVGGFLDVGANLGSCSLLLAQQGFSVTSLEPNEHSARLLRAAVLRNSLEQHVRVVQAAAGAHGVRASVHCSAHSARCQVFEDAAGDVQSVALDSLTELGPPERDWPLHALKIDVEGSEEQVIHGAQRLLASKPLLFLELHAYELRFERGGSSGQLVDRLLDELGYQSVEPLESDLRCEESESPPGNGTYPGATWGPAATMLGQPFEVASPCLCAQTCWKRLLQGCRCWSFQMRLKECQFYRSCHPPAALAPAASVAGEMNGNWEDVHRFGGFGPFQLQLQLRWSSLRMTKKVRARSPRIPVRPHHPGLL